MTPEQLSERLWQFAARIAEVVAILVEECDQLCRILGKSIATAKAGRKQPSGDGVGTRLPITDDKFSMTNSQSKGPRY
jgi:hypothetical protein